MLPLLFSKVNPNDKNNEEAHLCTSSEQGLWNL